MIFINAGKHMPLLPSPSHHNVFVFFFGGMVAIPSHGWLMALFYPHYNDVLSPLVNR